jgi:ribosomal protein S27E
MGIIRIRKRIKRERNWVYINCPRCKGHQGYITSTGKVRCFVCGKYL